MKNSAVQGNRLHNAIRQQIRHHAKRIAHYANISERSVQARATGDRKYDLREAPMFAKITGDYGPIEAAAAECGRMVVEVPEVEVLDAVSVGDLYRESGEVGVTFVHAVADNHISLDELTHINDEGDDVIRAILTMKAMAKRAYEAGCGQLEFATLAEADAL